jgi:hypothetical protein
MAHLLVGPQGPLLIYKRNKNLTENMKNVNSRGLELGRPAD